MMDSNCFLSGFLQPLNVLFSFITILLQHVFDGIILIIFDWIMLALIYCLNESFNETFVEMSSN